MTTQTTTAQSETGRPSTRPLTRHLPTAARVLLGLAFLASGIGGLLMAAGVVPLPQQPGPEGATAFMGALAKTGYMFALIKATETIVGALLLSNRFVPLALVILAPVLVNIVAFHAFLAPSGLGPALVLTALGGFLAWSYRVAYRPLLTTRARAGKEA